MRIWLKEMMTSKQKKSLKMKKKIRPRKKSKFKVLMMKMLRTTMTKVSETRMRNLVMKIRKMTFHWIEMRC